MAEQRKLRLENVKLCCRNFSGDKFGKGGQQSFGVIIDEELAQELEDAGWDSVRYMKPQDDDPEQFRQPWLLIKFKFGVNRDGDKTRPQVSLIIPGRGKKRLDRETIGQLDWTMIDCADVICHPFEYPAMQGRPAGISTWLDKLYVTVRVDDFDSKYADLPELD